MSLNPLKQFGYKLRTTTQVRQRLLNQTLKSHDLTHAQYMMMQYLYRADQKKKLSDMSQSQIAQSMGLNTMMVSNVLVALEKKKMIVRGKIVDTSSYTISLTDHGSLMVIQAHAAVQSFEEKLFDKKSLSAIEKHVDELLILQEEKIVSSDEEISVVVGSDDHDKKDKKDKKEHKKDKKKKNK